MMHMTFYWGKSVTLLFDEWSVNSWMGYTLTLIACFLFSILHEWLATQRTAFIKPAAKAATAAHHHPKSDSTQAPLLRDLRGGSNNTGKRALEALLFGVKVALGYLIMLAVMSYNGGVFLSIVAGLSVGYFLFRSGSDAPSFHDPCCSS